MSRVSSQRKSLGQGGANSEPKAQALYAPPHPQQYHLNLSPSTMYSHPPPGYYDPNMYHHPQPHPYGNAYGFSTSDSGSSRSPLPLLSRELYSGYPMAPTQRSSSSDHPTPPTPRQWQIHPGQQPSNGVPVKLEDLVSQDRDTSGRGGNSRGPGGFSSMPLQPGHGQSAVAGPSRTSRAAAKAAADPSAAGPSDFIKKLYKMLEEESAMYGKGMGPGYPRGSNAERGSVGWARGGVTFVVWDMNEFSTKVLPQTFRHSNFSSFVRQLNKYGFSKIKHTDEETGAIKENMWEFQHPNFQAGGKSDLDSIKRKAAVSKKVDVDTETSPAARQPDGPSAEQYARLVEMESRVQGLEDQLANALEEVRQVRMREQGTAGLLREMLSHMTNTERTAATSSTSSSEPDPSPHIMRMWHLYEQLLSAQQSDAQPTFEYTPLQPPSNPQTARPHERLSLTSTIAEPSPLTDGSRRSLGSSLVEATSDDVELGEAMPSIPEQSMYPPDGVNPVYAETPAWLTKGVTVPMPMYHRKNSDGLAFQVMMGALGTQGVKYDEGHDPLEPTLGQAGGSQHLIDPRQQPRLTASIPREYQPSFSRVPIIQSSPFGTVLIPSESSVHPNAVPPPKAKASAKSKDKTVAAQKSPTEANAKPLRRASVIQPHWNKTPRILVVEDDMVYRQLSKKFLEKFGCVVETVENAHEAIEMINRTKYDLVLMDIFFGPSMDGRKATSLIRQFDRYTPIISMTSNAQPQDISSYLQSGMNDILAKPFTKHGLFGILDKHLLHMKVLQLSAEVPRSVGVPPLSDQGVQEAVAQGAAVASGLLNWGNDEMRNPLAAMGWSDDTYQIVLDQFLRTGTMPDVTNFNFLTGQPIAPPHQITNGFPGSSGMGAIVGVNGGGTIGPSAIFGDFNSRKRSLEMGDGIWSAASGTPAGGLEQQNGEPSVPATTKKEAKRAKR